MTSDLKKRAVEAIMSTIYAACGSMFKNIVRPDVERTVDAVADVLLEPTNEALEVGKTYVAGQPMPRAMIAAAAFSAQRAQVRG